MSLLSRLFGARDRGQEPEPEPELYNGYAITPAPIREEAGYRLCARIVPEDGSAEPETIIRADTIGDVEAARSVSLAKAKQVIDERLGMGRGALARPGPAGDAARDDVDSA